MFKYIFGIFAISIIPFFSIQSKETNSRIDLLSKKLENLQEEKMNRILDLEKIEETYLISFESDDIPEPIQKSLSKKEEEISKLDNKIKRLKQEIITIQQNQAKNNPELAEKLRTMEINPNEI